MDAHGNLDVLAEWQRIVLRREGYGSERVPVRQAGRAFFYGGSARPWRLRHLRQHRGQHGKGGETSSSRRVTEARAAVLTAPIFYSSIRWMRGHDRLRSVKVLNVFTRRRGNRQLPQRGFGSSAGFDHRPHRHKLMDGYDYNALISRRQTARARTSLVTAWRSCRGRRARVFPDQVRV